jgi:uroporphyrin-3 C-methyltransferase
MTDGPTPAPHPRLAWFTPAFVLALLALLVTLGLAWNAHLRLHEMELQLARRIGEFDTASREARAAAQAANHALTDLQGRLAALESRGQETQDQQLALTAMYQDLARSNDERVVADIEQTLLLAEQQVQLAGNLKAALIGLEAAQVRLKQLNKPQFASLARALTQDTERLKLLPAADIDGLSARLEALMQDIDVLKPESESEPPAKPAPTAAKGPVDTLARFGREAWDEFKGLVRIRRLDHPELPLLTPQQIHFLRENLRLRLISARVAALRREEATFRADISAARDWTLRYFNRQDPASKLFIDRLVELGRAPVALRDSPLAASLKAVRSLRKEP